MGKFDKAILRAMESCLVGGIEVTDSCMDFGKIKIAAVFEHPFLQYKGNEVVLTVQITDEEYYVIGYQTDISLLPGDAKNMDILELEEGEFTDGEWKRSRRLNGDEADDLSMADPKLLRIKVHTYQDEI